MLVQAGIGEKITEFIKVEIHFYGFKRTSSSSTDLDAQKVLMFDVYQTIESSLNINCMYIAHVCMRYNLLLKTNINAFNSACKLFFR